MRHGTRRLSDNWDRGEGSGGRSHIFTDLRDNSGSMARTSGDIWGVIPLSALDHQLSDSLLAIPEQALRYSWQNAAFCSSIKDEYSFSKTCGELP